MTSGSNAKGGQFERDIARALSEWVTRGERKDVFWRTAMSGGRATLNNRRCGDEITVRQCGDLCAVAAEGYDFASRWYVECKSRKNLYLKDFLFFGTGGRDSLSQFWNTAKAEAERYDRMPMLIAKQNGFPTLVVVEHYKPIHLALPHVCVQHLDYETFFIFKLSDYLQVEYNDDVGDGRPASKRKPARQLSPPLHAKDAAGTDPKARRRKYMVARRLD